MDFEFTKEQRDIQKAVREFVRAEYDKDAVMQLELEHKFPWELWRKACELGFTGVDFPEEYGCLLYTSPSPRDLSTSRMPSSA